MLCCAYIYIYVYTYIYGGFPFVDFVFVVVARTNRRCGRGCYDTHASPQPLKTFKNQYRKRRRKGTSILPNWATLDAPFRETHLGVPPMMPPVWTSTGCSRQERRTGGLRVARCATLRNPSGRPTSAADRTQPTDRPADRPTEGQGKETGFA